MLLTLSPSSQLKVLYNPKAFFTHAALLDQACAHCPIFPTAASRRSLGRVSDPVWLIILSDQLTIVALVGHYPTNKLIVRRLLSRRIAALALGLHAVLAVVSHSCPPPGDRYLRVTHPSATACLLRPCDLHVLSMPPAFALSQDQTLRFISMIGPRNTGASKTSTNKTQLTCHAAPQETTRNSRNICQRIVKTR